MPSSSGETGIDLALAAGSSEPTLREASQASALHQATDGSSDVRDGLSAASLTGLYPVAELDTQQCAASSLA